MSETQQNASDTTATSDAVTDDARLSDPALARIASLPLAERAAAYEALYDELRRQLDVSVSQEPLEQPRR